MAQLSQNLDSTKRKISASIAATEVLAEDSVASPTEKVESESGTDAPATFTPPLKRKKNSNKGRHGDPRMHRSVAARLMNPELSLLEALLEGGFSFPEGTEGSGKSDRTIHDADGVLLCQRKNQLSRRLRLAKKRQQSSRPVFELFATETSQQNSNDSRTLQNLLLNGQLPINNSRNNQINLISPSQQLNGLFFQQAGSFDPTIIQGNETPGGSKDQGFENNLQQYLQLTSAANAMGIRTEQLQAMRFQGPIFPGFPTFQQLALAQQPQNLLQNKAVDINTAVLNSGIMSNQMHPFLTIATPGNTIGLPVQFNNGLGKMLMNTQILANAGASDKQQNSDSGGK